MVVVDLLGLVVIRVLVVFLLDLFLIVNLVNHDMELSPAK
jgi:hypothetical protein